MYEAQHQSTPVAQQQPRTATTAPAGEPGGEDGNETDDSTPSDDSDAQRRRQTAKGKARAPRSETSDDAGPSGAGPSHPENEDEDIARARQRINELIAERARVDLASGMDPHEREFRLVQLDGDIKDNEDIIYGSTMGEAMARSRRENREYMAQEARRNLGGSSRNTRGDVSTGESIPDVTITNLEINKTETDKLLRSLLDSKSDLQSAERDVERTQEDLE
jgi:hypothetical protein